MKRLALVAAGCTVVAALLAAGAMGLAWWRGWLPHGTHTGFVAAGPLQGPEASFELAIYFLPKPEHDPLPALERLLAGEFKMFERRYEETAQPSRPTVRAVVRSDVAQGYAPPGAKTLDLFAKGLSPAQKQALQGTQQALALDFNVPGPQAWAGAQAAERLVLALVRRTGGLVWDESSRQVYTPEAWEQERVASWKETVPDVSRHVAIHSYDSNGSVRSVTVGMQKFALPDLFVGESSWSLNRNVGHVINLTAQAIAEGAVVGARGAFPLRVHDIRDASVRERQVRSFEKHATGEAVLILRDAKPEEGDAPNRLVEISFEHYRGADVHVRQETAVAEFFGAADEQIEHTKHDADLLAARDRARSHLPELQKAFDKGLAPGAFLMLKVPFDTTSGGHEWMWVEVTSWKGNRIAGILQNDPEDVPGLRTGSPVKANEDDVFDYLLHRADGSEEGNETSRVILARQKAGQAAGDMEP